MLKVLAMDTKNDVTLFHCGFSPRYAIRYGLQITREEELALALIKFRDCQAHALAAQGYNIN